MNSHFSTKLFDHDTFYKAFERDLKGARYGVLIESPFITTKRMASLLPILDKVYRRGVRIVVNTRNPDEHNTELATQTIQSIIMMQEIGVTVLFTGKHHRKLAIIDGEILWEGSLNILSQNDSCEIMRRMVSRQLANEMIAFLALNKHLTYWSSKFE